MKDMLALTLSLVEKYSNFKQSPAEVSMLN